MKTRTTTQTLILVATALLCVAVCETARSQTSTAFTYSGHLSQAGQPANQPHDLTFRLFTTALGGSPVAAVTNANVAVSKGVFITSVDFGPGFFDGPDYWLELGVRPGGTSVAFNILDPRQPITRTPYALWASRAAEATSAQTARAVAVGAVSRDGLANGAVTTEKIFDGTIAFNDLSAPAQNAFWRTVGNAGTTAGTHFLGTTDNQPLELKVNGLRAGRLEFAGDSSEDGNTVPDGAPNVILGAPVNFVAAGVAGATIAGGGATNYSDFFTTNYGNFGRTNSIWASYGALGGGLANRIAPWARWSTIAGGGFHDIGTNSFASAIGGGQDNNIAAISSASTIAGGVGNNIGTYSEGSAIGGGEWNEIATNSAYSTIAGGWFNHASGGSSIGGGVDNKATNDYATVGGGQNNTAGGQALWIPGYSPRGVATHSTVSGGASNQARRGYAFIGGGFNNINVSMYSVVAGGADNYITGIDYPDSGTNCCEGYGNTISGGMDNTIVNSTVLPFGSFSTIAGGHSNTTYGYAATIAGGENNWAASYAFAAGRRAKANYPGSFVWADSTEADFASTGANQFLIRAAGGVGINTAPAYTLDARDDQAVGRFTTTNQIWGSVIELRNTTPSSTYLGGINFNDSGSTFPGQIAYLANHNMTFQTARAERLRVDGQGRVGIGTATPTERLHVSGNILATGTITPNSDRNAKTGFASVDTAAVLDRVTKLPIQQWRFKAESDEVKHVGPMAQDFRAAFGLGAHETAIATVDADGVALAAIQGLNQKVEHETKQKDAEIAELKHEIGELKQLIRSLAAQNGGAR